MTTKNPSLNSEMAGLLQLAVFMITAIWHTGIVTISALLCLLAKRLALKWHSIFIPGLLIAAGSMGLDLVSFHPSGSATDFMVRGFEQNRIFWQLLFRFNFKIACYYVYHASAIYLLGMPLL